MVRRMKWAEPMLYLSTYTSTPTEGNRSSPTHLMPDPLQYANNIDPILLSFALSIEISSVTISQSLFVYSFFSVRTTWRCSIGSCGFVIIYVSISVSSFGEPSDVKPILFNKQIHDAIILPN